MQKLNFKCVHSVKGYGGVKKMVIRISDALGNYCYVFATDIKGYYESINHAILYKLLSNYMAPCQALDIIDQYYARLEIYNGDYVHVNQGIPQGGILSPLLGNLYLKPVDDLFRNQKNIFYARYMDDIVILTKTRSKLRKVIKQLYKVLDKLKLKLSKPKTFIGKIERGFSIVLQNILFHLWTQCSGELYKIKKYSF